METIKKEIGMNQIVKERIEQIRQGIVPEGYKETRIGVVPKDWELKKMKEVLDFKNGINAKKEQYGKGVKFINVLDILNNNFITYEKIIDRVDIDKETLENNKVEYGDILFQRSSETVNEAGTANVYLSEEPVTFGGFVIRGKKKGKYNPLFMNYLLKGDFYRKQVEQKAAGSTRYNIGQQSLEEIFFSSPLLNEQQQIADILSTWNRAIELKESLIKEKQEQKKGLMRQIFSQIDKSTFVGNLIKESKVTEESPTVERLLTVRLHLEGVFKRELRGNETVGATTLYKRKSGQFIYGKQNFHNGALGIVPDELDDFLSSSDIPSFDFELDEVNPLYFYYYWSKESNYRRLAAFTTGTGSRRLNPKEFYKIKMKLPSIEEQENIANILSTIDKQISLLKQELELLRQQKKGLMQLLLTGIVRVGEVD